MIEEDPKVQSSDFATSTLHPCIAAAAKDPAKEKEAAAEIVD